MLLSVILITCVFGQSLDKIVKLELLEKENAETIHKIWTDFHADKDCITASIPASVYGTLYQNSLKFPMVSNLFI
jgi:ATP synthase mitochondrial F1 complex assembly factor 1